MMFRSLFVLAALSAASTSSAFQPVNKANNAFQLSPLAMTSKHSDEDQQKKSTKNPLASLAVAGTIFATTLAGSVAVPPPALADVELSTGAILINTSTKPGQSLLKAEVDAKGLLGTLIKNRKAFKESVGRITNVVQEELASPVWQELGKEVLQIEGDVAPEFRISAPRDWQVTLRDVSKGKLNLIVNGEIINLSIEETSTASEDDLVIRAKGVRGVGLPTFTEPAVTQVRTRLEDQLDTVRNFWYSPLALPEVVQDKLPEDFQVDKGTAIVVGSVATVGGAYSASYAYYLNEQAEAAKKAEEQRKKVAARKKAAAEAAAKKKAAEEAEESS